MRHSGYGDQRQLTRTGRVRRIGIRSGHAQSGPMAARHGAMLLGQRLVASMEFDVEHLPILDSRIPDAPNRYLARDGAVMKRRNSNIVGVLATVALASSSIAATANWEHKVKNGLSDRDIVSEACRMPDGSDEDQQCGSAWLRWRLCAQGVRSGAINESELYACFVRSRR